ncbi:family 20 glycosylhydrolase [Streptomyces griseoviridis]
MRRHHGTTPRMGRVLGSLLLVTAAGAFTAAAAPVPGTPPVTPLDRVVPAPAMVAPGGAPYRITRDTAIRVADTREARRIGAYLASLLRPSTGFPLPVTTQGRGGIRLHLDPGRYGAEGYRLDSGSGGVTITAGAPAGLFHGVQTLRQLLPAAVESAVELRGPWLIAGGTVQDRPRYGWRGAMLDVPRDLGSVERVQLAERYVDALALYKLNRLHLRLGDGGPPLPAGDGGPGGHWTADDYRAIVRYAAARFVEVVPEIGLGARWAGGDADDADAVDRAVRDLAALTPGRHLHIGGDEPHLTGDEEYGAFVDRVQSAVARYGRTAVGWHRITCAQPARGTLAQYRGVDGTGADERARVVAAARAGTGLILSPADRTRLDLAYPEPGACLDGSDPVGVRRSYDWDPGRYLAGVPEPAVKGVEASLGTGKAATGDALARLAFPRLPGVAELGWSPADTHDWDAYRVRLAAQGPRWDTLGIAYHRSPEVPWPTG